MGIFSKFQTKTIELKNMLIAKAITQRITPEEERVDLDKLEGAYRKDPLIYNSINIISHIAMTSGHTFIGTNKEWINNFTNNIGEIGNKITWYELLERTIRYTCIYGKSFWELIYNTRGNRIVDIDMLDSKNIDYAKDSRKNIVLDANGNPIGFTQNVNNVYGDFENKIEPPDEVKLYGKMIYIPADNIAMFKMNTIGDGFYPVGLIEPIYDITVQKKQEEMDLSNASRAPLRVASVGDQNHNPTDNMIANTSDQLAKASPLSAYAHPDWVKPYILEPAHIQDTTIFLKYWKDRQIEVLGVPEAFSTGKGESTNRATLARQEYILKLLVKTLMDKSIVSSINQNVFKRIAFYEGFESPKIQWGEIAIEDIDAKATRLSNYARFGLITPSKELMKYVLDSEAIPEECQGKFNKIKPVEKSEEKNKKQKEDKDEDDEDNEE